MLLFGARIPRPIPVVFNILHKSRLSSNLKLYFNKSEKYAAGVLKIFRLFRKTSIINDSNGSEILQFANCKSLMICVLTNTFPLELK